MLPKNMHAAITKKHWRRIAKHFGFNHKRDLPFLGNGKYAYVHALNKYRTIKITGDVTDAKTAFYFMHNPCPFIVRTHAVVEIADAEGPYDGYFAMITGRMYKKDPVWEEFLYEYGISVHENYCNYKECVAKWPESKRAKYKKQLSWLKRFHRWKRTKGAGYKMGDMHNANIMQDARGWLRITDTGFSQGSSIHQGVEIPKIYASPPGILTP